MSLKRLNKSHRIITLQLIGWGVILGTSLLWSINTKSNLLDSFGVILLIINILTLLLIYVINYTQFIPRFLFKDRRNYFIICNTILIIVLLLCSHLANENDFFGLLPLDIRFRPKHNLMYLVRDLINYVLMVGLVVALRLAQRLQKSEEALKEAENARVKAELDNLRSQINPHFLLNTLNNIYALTAIDTEKAQKTIKELSSLLRYILYDNQNERVSLVGEIDFLKTYIELMSIRLPRKVELKTEFKLSKTCTTQIAPLIFISLIENAFKHSVNASGEGFIHIYFEDNSENNRVTLSITNSNHAKLDQDKSGHGIGLEQVQRRLDLLYPGNYKWSIENSEKIYSSILTLKHED